MDSPPRQLPHSRDLSRVGEPVRAASFLRLRPAGAVALVAMCAVLTACTVDFTGSSGGADGGPDGGPGPECGNGVINPGELCDGTDLGGQTCLSAMDHQHGDLGCREDCRLDFSDCHTCGDGLLDGPETCDDQNTDVGDGCSDLCETEPGWVCTGQPSVCAFTCGNSVLDTGETCDDGNITVGDGCSPSCQTEPGWVCSGEPSTCTPVCGDGMLRGSETCDDGNATDGDGCSPSCQTEPGWECSGEPSVCTPGCGDGTMTGSETCDDGNTTDGDGCSALCQIEAGWQCSSEPSTCTSICGDGLVVGSEPCDDGNTTNNDGCSALCQVEDYHACSGQPSVCVCVVFVDKDTVTGPRNGRSWSRAYAMVQQGVDQAASLGGGCEVWAAEGRYHIYVSAVGDTLNLRAGVAVYGGFSGTETGRNQRDWSIHETILDGTRESDPTSHVDNVVSADNITGALLDGFTITGGEALGAPGEGGGLHVEFSTLTVANCRVEGNTASDLGGGIHANQSQVTITNCEFLSNTADIQGGGLRVYGGTVVVEHCTFQGNTSNNLGGGMYVTQTTATVDSCLFVNNTADDTAGGLRVFNATATVLNSVFRTNQAFGPGGGGIGTNGSGVQVDIVNCTFHGNTALAGWGGGIRVEDGNATVANSILWDNVPEQVYVTAATCTVSYSDVQGGYPGPGNLSTNPFFANPTAGDFHLTAGSLCIDAGNGDVAPAQDTEGNPRADDPNTANTGVGTPPYVDMGAYEFQP